MERQSIPTEPAGTAGRPRRRTSMPRPGAAEPFWPTALQRRLLSVALDEPNRAAAAWRELQPDLDFDRMEDGTFELMPLISRQLQAAGHDDPLSGRLNGIYRKSWFIHSLVLERSVSASESLPPRIEALFLQGRASGARYYPEAAMRYSPYAGLLVDDDSARPCSRAPRPCRPPRAARARPAHGGSPPALRRARQQHRPPHPIRGRLRRRRPVGERPSPSERRGVRRRRGSLRVPARRTLSS